jgi:hypothetical protein
MRILRLAPPLFARLVAPLAAALALGVSAGCVHPMIKYHKAKILDPMMDPAKTEGFQTSFRAEPSRWNERGAGDVGGALGGSCPTCGG